jgi:hypothetical protein
LHLQRNVNGGIRLANNEKQRRQKEQQFDNIYYPLFAPIWQGRLVPGIAAINRAKDAKSAWIRKALLSAAGSDKSAS